jgi:hypothetical protein
MGTQKLIYWVYWEKPKSFGNVIVGSEPNQLEFWQCKTNFGNVKGFG